MTGERELPVRLISEFSEEEEMAAAVEAVESAGLWLKRACGGSPAVKKPTRRTLGSITVRGRRRESMVIRRVGSVGDGKFCTKIRPRRIRQKAI